MTAIHNADESHVFPVDGGHELDVANRPTTSLAVPNSRPSDGLLLIWADILNDLEATRIANENRVRSLHQVKGLDDTDAAANLHGIVDALTTLEHGATLGLKRALRQHPFGPWVKQTIGVGEKQGARLLAAIGDPAWNSLHGRPRTVSELWAYCGLHVLHPGHSWSDAQVRFVGVDPSRAAHMRIGAHRSAGGAQPPNTSQTITDTQAGHAGVRSSDPTDQRRGAAQASAAGGVAPRRTRGQQANWNSDAKMRVYLVAESCMKQRRSPYRAVYDTGRTKYADATHNAPCARCGPQGKPAPTGSPLSAGHQHARAMRLVMKAILKDLWHEARALHDPNTSQPSNDTHVRPAGVRSTDPADQARTATHPALVSGVDNQ